MKRFLKIVGLGLIIWSFSLVWPTINLALSPWMIVTLVAGLGAIILAYLVGQHVGREYRNGTAKEIFHSRRTHPMPVNTIRNHSSRQTSPMPVVTARNPASRPTRPMPMAR